MVNRKNTPYIIGLVGKAGSGKSTVAKILVEQYGFCLLSLDAIGHEALEACKEDLVAVFGGAILSDGSIQRPALSQMVFGNMEKLLTLNAITHPKIKQIVKQRLSCIQRHTVLDGALLYEIGLAPLCDLILMVEAPEEMLFLRLVNGRAWPEEKAKSVLRSQEYLRFIREQADFIIFNNDGLEKIQRQIDFFVHTLE